MARLYQNHENMKQTDPTIKFVLLVLTTLLLPFALIIIEKTLLPYPVFFEEIAKALVIFFLILNLPKTKYKIAAGVLFGFLFGLSENIFYLTNFIESGELTVFWQRFLWTVPMHIVTVLVMVFAGLKRKWLLIFGLAVAIILHTLFNNIAVELLIL
jgi:hypothetical protein